LHNFFYFSQPFPLLVRLYIERTDCKIVPYHLYSIHDYVQQTILSAHNACLIKYLLKGETIKMKKKLTKALALGLSLAAALTLTTGCGKKEDTTSDTPVPAVTSESSSDNSGSETAAVRSTTPSVHGCSAVRFPMKRHWNYLRVPVCTE
jgi:hypothetical protein